jgi:hypothetical protein
MASCRASVELPISRRSPPYTGVATTPPQGGRFGQVAWYSNTYRLPKTAQTHEVNIQHPMMGRAMPALAGCQAVQALDGTAAEAATQNYAFARAVDADHRICRTAKEPAPVFERVANPPPSTRDRGSPVRGGGWRQPRG